MVHWSVDCIVNMMKNYEINPNEVQKKHQKQFVRGLGRFHCGTCKGCWTSVWSAFIFDLSRQKVVRSFKQKCKKCLFAATAFFVDKRSLDDMLEYICERYIQQINNTSDVVKRDSVKSRDKEGDSIGSQEDGDEKQEKSKPVKPHRSDLCELCGYGPEKTCFGGGTTHRRRRRRNRVSSSRLANPEE